MSLKIEFLRHLVTRGKKKKKTMPKKRSAKWWTRPAGRVAVGVLLGMGLLALYIAGLIKFIASFSPKTVEWKAQTTGARPSFFSGLPALTPLETQQTFHCPVTFAGSGYGFVPITVDLKGILLESSREKIYYDWVAWRVGAQACYRFLYDTPIGSVKASHESLEKLAGKSFAVKFGAQPVSLRLTEPKIALTGGAVSFEKYRPILEVPHTETSLPLKNWNEARLLICAELPSERTGTEFCGAAATPDHPIARQEILDVHFVE